MASGMMEESSGGLGVIISEMENLVGELFHLPVLLLHSLILIALTAILTHLLIQDQKSNQTQNLASISIKQILLP